MRSSSSNRLVDLPYWTKFVPGFRCEAYNIPIEDDFYLAPRKIINRRSGRYKPNGAISVKYIPASRDVGIGFEIIYLLDEDCQPFINMPGIWKYLSENGVASDIRIDRSGRTKCPNGCLTPEMETVVLEQMLMMRDKWKLFPNEKDYGVVEGLCEAKRDIHTMVREKSRLEDSIDYFRNQMENCRNRLAKYESELNNMYEKAATAMNYLEERGYPQDLDKIEQELNEDKKENLHPF